ncbi:cancer-related regulator of actin dynamics [Camelus ferus]|uniref:Cancer-related regulator of actin dynamics n=1 Tax=Camelus ferus TaxID=419612 RepID=A0A8B7K5E2_CAMFR|nr:cancer-related regulator of actin dynamics [Camelus ferus]
MGEQKVSRQFKQCHRTTSWAKSKLFSRLSSMFLRQLGKNIKFGQPPPTAIPTKKADSGEARLEEDPFLTSPMETVTQQDSILSDPENKTSETPSSPSPLNLPGARSEMEEKVAPLKPSRPKRHFSSAGTIESVNLDAIPLAIARLDNSAAKHKLSVKPKNQRVSKKHRRLIGDRQNEHGGLPRQLSLDQNGHPGEEKPIWHEEEPELLDSEEERRRQEEYWRELEAKCKRQKAEAAERRRLEEQRLQALERRLWEENRQQELLEEEGEGEEERDVQEEVEKRQREAERPSPEEPGCRGPERREQEEGRRAEAGEPRRPEEEAHQEEPEALSPGEAPRQSLEEEERELKELRRLEELEEQRQQEAEKKRLEEEKRLEELRRQELEELRRQEEEKQEQRRREEEEQRRREEEEEQRRQEAEEKRMEDLRRQEELELQRRQEEEEAKRREELRKWEDMEAKRRQEAEKKLREAPRGEEEHPPQLDHKRGLRSPFQSDFAEKLEEHKHLKLKKPRENPEEPSICEKQSPVAAEPSGEQQGKQGDVPGDDRCGHQEKREETNAQPPQRQEAQLEETLAPREKKEAAAPETDRKMEELRWQEVDERQTMPRPYTFQVSSGGKQILFPKVNLSPVTPMKDAGLASTPQEPKAPKASPASHSLPSSLSIPHTAILVTGAQLCGPAVNLSQIKDTACKSLLGLSEEKKHVDVPALENPPRAPGDPRAGGGKARPPQESPSSVAALAEWASIRSRILKNAEGDHRSERDQARPGDEYLPRGRCDSRGNLRRTPPVNAKFSIKPAWQKFPDGGAEASKQNTEPESIKKKLVPGPSEEAAPQPPAADTHEPLKAAGKPGARQEPTDTTEGYKFAKDLPSFLVPSLPYPPQKVVAQAEPVTTSDSETTGGVGKPDPVMPGGEEKASPFGIKLRRTNYSLRFHCDQQTEQKKKKRHSSMGDNIDGAPPAPGGTNEEKEREAAALRHGPSFPLERKQAPSTWKDLTESPSSHSPPAGQPRPPPASSQPPAPEHDKAANRMPLAQKPALAPKPTGQTPPSSPLSKVSRPYLVELLARRIGKPDPEPNEPCKEGQDSGDPRPLSPPPPEERKRQKWDEEEEMETERRPASLAPTAARQEKPSLTPEAGRKEKPVLQSRHSLDGSKLVEKVETPQPLWITLALQKQKGFREQQATREERKQAREAKQAEKLSKENVSGSPLPGSSSVSRGSSLHKSTAQPEEKKPETAVSRLERREQLKKANTLPTSVTVEISDSAPPAPLVKEVTKRFSTPDAAPVSTEPAWLALAKRKAKAWSDCPQIIK